MRRPSISSRLSFAVSTAERGEAGEEGPAPAGEQIEEEIAEIKRYEVRGGLPCIPCGGGGGAVC